MWLYNSVWLFSSTVKNMMIFSQKWSTHLNVHFTCFQYRLAMSVVLHFFFIFLNSLHIGFWLTVHQFILSEFVLWLNFHILTYYVGIDFDYRCFNQVTRRPCLFEFFDFCLETSIGELRDWLIVQHLCEIIFLLNFICLCYSNFSSRKITSSSRCSLNHNSFVFVLLLFLFINRILSDYLCLF